jgi:hypothetical protein
VEEDEVFAAIMSIGSGAVGADGFSLKFLKIVLPHILSVITHLFNFSITTSTFPSAWKTALVLPLPKCGSPTGLSDFRPISILPVLFKGFERLICNQFVDYLDSGRLLSPYQSGFRNCRSTATALTKIKDDIHLGVERLRFSISVLLDFSKAFDSMSHDLLLHKLRFKFGLSSTACRLFGSFLFRKFRNILLILSILSTFFQNSSEMDQVNLNSVHGALLQVITTLSAIFFDASHTSSAFSDYVLATFTEK